MSVQDQVKQFIVENFYVSDPAELGVDTSLITGGYVDSTGMLELIRFLEGEFEIQIADHEMVPANLETIRQIGQFVNAKKPATIDPGR